MTDPTWETSVPIIGISLLQAQNVMSSVLHADAGYPGNSGSHLLAATQANQPWQHLQPQQQQSGWAQQAQHPQQQAQHAQHMNPYQQSQGVFAQSHGDHRQQQQQQQQQLMHNMPEHQLNAYAQEWKPRWA